MDGTLTGTGTTIVAGADLLLLLPQFALLFELLLEALDPNPAKA